MNLRDLVEFDSVTRALDLEEDFEVFRAGWAASQAALTQRASGLLSLESVEAACRYMHMGGDTAEVFLGALAEVHRNAALERMLWHCYYRFFHREAAGCDKPSCWPMFPEHLGDAGRLAYAFVLVAGVPQLRALHQAREIPNDVTVETLSDIEVWMREYRKMHGVWGFDRMPWLTAHFEGRVVRLGRLQFEPRRLPADVHALRNRATGRVVVFAGAGQRFRTDGQFDGVNGIFDAAGAWSSVFTRDDHVIHGNPIAVDGRALRRTATLPADKWEIVLENNGPTLGVHIPAVGPLSPSACEASFERALRFFPEYYPEHDFRAFDCNSWLLDHQLEDYLPDSSNIARFLREFYLLPSPTASDAQPLERVLGVGSADFHALPQQTSLQRCMAAHMKQGGRWRTAQGFRLREDFGRGPAYYRRMAAGTPWGRNK